MYLPYTVVFLQHVVVEIQLHLVQPKITPVEVCRVLPLGKLHHAPDRTIDCITSYTTACVEVLAGYDFPLYVATASPTLRYEGIATQQNFDQNMCLKFA